MTISTRLRLATATVLGAGAYSVLLYLSYSFLEDSYIPPQWWIDRLHTQPFASTAWFLLINGAGAIAAAIPVAAGVVLLCKAHKRSLSLGIGSLSALCFVSRGIAEYGYPSYSITRVIELLQFLSIAFSVLLLVAFFASCIEGDGRGCVIQQKT
jgi:hypothetical protein